MQLFRITMDQSPRYGRTPSLESVHGRWIRHDILHILSYVVVLDDLMRILME
jgi:hypothetical protein